MCSRYSNCKTVEVTEIPRCCSRAIQSDVALRRPARAFTAPASATAPAYNRNFSVRVVLPASGWLMMANVRRRLASMDSFLAGLAVFTVK